MFFFLLFCIRVFMSVNKWFYLYCLHFFLILGIFLCSVFFSFLFLLPSCVNLFLIYSCLCILLLLFICLFVILWFVILLIENLDIDLILRECFLWIVCWWIRFGLLFLLWYYFLFCLCMCIMCVMYLFYICEIVYHQKFLIVEENPAQT